MRKPHFEYQLRVFNSKPKITSIFGLFKPNLMQPVVSQIKNFQNFVDSHPDSRNAFSRLSSPSGVHIEAMYWIFKCHGQKIFKIANRFGRDLMQADLKLSNKFLPITNEIICIELPDDLEFKDKDEVFRSFYIFIQDGADVDHAEGPISKLITIMNPIGKPDGTWNPGFADIMVMSFKNEEEDFESSLARAEKHSSIPIIRSMLEYILKCLIYIYSGDPDLRDYTAPPPPLSKKAKIIRQWEREPLLNMKLVGYDWEKERIYNIDETLRRGHPRWQPCGPGMSQVKLIWIEPHIVRFKHNKVVLSNLDGEDSKE